MKYKIIILMCMLLLALPLISADENDITPLGVTYDYKFPCYNNGTFCSGSAVCNVTVLNPKFLVIVDGVAATNNGNYHNITILAPTLQTPGTHNVILTCTDGSLSNSNNDFFLVTESNFVYNTGLSFLTPGRFLLLFNILLICLGFLYIAKFSDINAIGTIAISFASMFLMVQGVSTIKNGFDNLITPLTEAMGMGFIAFGGLLLIIVWYMKFKDMF